MSTLGLSLCRKSVIAIVPGELHAERAWRPSGDRAQREEFRRLLVTRKRAAVLPFVFKWGETD